MKSLPKKRSNSNKRTIVKNSTETRFGYQYLKTQPTSTLKQYGDFKKKNTDEQIAKGKQSMKTRVHTHTQPTKKRMD